MVAHFCRNNHLYHLKNLNSIEEGKESVQYKYVNIILEEVELYFHPEYQRQFVNKLIRYLEVCNFSKLDYFNVIIATHSPFILSDIPHDNIMFLKNGKQEDDSFNMTTFGANIHDMLRNSFFLENGSMGEFARETINELISILNFLKEYNENEKNSSKNNSEMTDYLKNEYSDLYNSVISNDKIDREKVGVVFSKEKIHKKIMLIDESIIRISLLQLFEDIFYDIINEEQSIKELKKELDRRTLKLKLERLK